MSYIRRNLDETKNNIALYTVEIEDGKTYMNLDKVEYKCCGLHQYTDLAPVPPAKVNISCSNCHRDVIELDSDDFRIPMIPIDEVYDHVPFLGLYC